MNNNKQIEKKYRKELKEAYDLAASVDDRSDVQCLIDRAIYLITKCEEKAYLQGVKEATDLAEERVQDAVRGFVNTLIDNSSNYDLDRKIRISEIKKIEQLMQSYLLEKGINEKI